MCFRFGSCFGNGSGQDYGRSTPKTTHRGGGRSHWGSLAIHGYYSGADQKAALQAYHHQPASGGEAGAGVQKDHTDGTGGHPAYAQDKADNTLQHPAAWNGKVGDDAGHTYTERLHDAAAYHREHAAADYHRYPTTATANLPRY